MPRGPNGEWRPTDMNQLAKHIVDLATGQATDEQPEPTGRARSSYARAHKLSAEKRSAIARKAAKARWQKRKEIVS